MSTHGILVKYFKHRYHDIGVPDQIPCRQSKYLHLSGYQPQLDTFRSFKQRSTKKSLTAIKTIGPLLAANSVRWGSHKMPAINSPLSLDFITSPTTAIWLKIILFGRFPFRTKVNRNVQEREADRKLAENTESAKDRSEVRRARGPGGLDIVRHLY